MRVDQVMSKPAMTCLREGRLDDAVRIMWENDVGVVPAVDADGRLAGILTDRDACMAAFTNSKDPHGIPLAQVLTTAVVSCRPGDSLETAQQLMAARRVRRIPVVDEQLRPIGLLSLDDIARQAVKHPAPDEMRRVVETLAAACQPRQRGLHVDKDMTAAMAD